MNLSTIRKCFFPGFLGYLLLSSLFIWIGLWFHPDPVVRTSAFWVAIGVLEIILAVPFLAAAFLVFQLRSGKNSYGMGGVAPGLFKAILGYMGATGLLIAGNGFVANLDATLGQYMSMVQLCLVGVAAAYGSFLQFVRTDQESALDDKAATDDSPRSLAALVRAKEQRITITKMSQPLLDSMSGLRDELSYRLPGTGKVMVNPRYMRLTADLRRLVNEIHDGADPKHYQIWKQKIDVIRSEAQVVRDELKS